MVVFFAAKSPPPWTFADDDTEWQFLTTQFDSKLTLIVGTKIYKENGVSMIMIHVKASHNMSPNELLKMKDEVPDIVSISV